MKSYRVVGTLSVTAGFLVLGLLVATASRADSDPLPKPKFNSKGELVRPIGYREWVYVGTPLTPNDLNPPEAPFPEFHNVYIHPDDYEHWKTKGEFPDGTVIVKELLSVGSKRAVSGKGYFMGDFIGLEATVKDSKRFKNVPGFWAYFSFGHSYPLAKTAAAFPEAACHSCHAASAMDDFVFTQYYPVLSASKGPIGKDSASKGGAMTGDSKEFKEIAEAMMTATESIFEATAPTGQVQSEVPTGRQQLFRYLQSGDYKSLPARESGQHASRGPHTTFGLPVMVYMNSKLDQSLQAGNLTHPAGSASVKEMFDADGRLQGWAVMVKTQNNSDGGRGWFWYEITSTTDGSSPVGVGNGVPLCQGCHAIGSDFVLTEYPLN